jgi:hypothetical protein
MAITSAKRQARQRARIRAKADQGVTPDMIRRAVRIMFDDLAADQFNILPSWDEWLADCRKQQTGGSWSEFLPDGGDPDLYSDYGDDADLLAKVGAVVEAIRRPPPD